MRRLIGILCGTALYLCLAAAAEAQSDGRSYANHLTPEALRACLVTDYEMSNILSLIEPRRRQMNEARLELQQTDVESSLYADRRTRLEQLRLQYNSLVEDYEALTERFNGNCTQAYYQVDYVQVKKQLGYGWSSQ
ncbi:MAG: hypothetical protein WDZ84_15410 [Rhodovibrionaceae bacterium]